MQIFQTVIDWYVSHKEYVEFIKDVVFAIGAILTFVGVYNLLKFLAQRKTLNKKQEMEYDSRMYEEVHGKLKEYVEEYEASPKNMRDIGIRLLHIKNYPYNLDDDGYGFMLYYYFMTEHHKPSGYISGKGIYVLDYIRYLGNSIYVNPKNDKWFIDKKGKSINRYEELDFEQIIQHIPFANIYGYDFESDWADKGEPVFYTKYMYTDWRLYSNDIEAITMKNGSYPVDRYTLRKNKRARKFRTFIRAKVNRIKGHYAQKRSEKRLKEAISKQEK